MPDARQPPAIVPPLDGSPFVGRDAELEWLGTIATHATNGGGRLALLSGEPGIGKTRLLAEFSCEAAKNGWSVLTGRALESEGMPPYLPLVAPLREFVRGLSEEELRRVLGRGAAEVSVLIPELLDVVPDIEANPRLGSDARYRLFEAMTDFLCEAARREAVGLLIALEDLHWADEATLRLLEHLGRRLPEAPLLLVATCRGADADRSRTFTEVVVALRRERLCQELEVPPLTLMDVTVLVEGIGGSRPTPELAELIHNETGGNPFFLEEVVRKLLAEGRNLSDHADARAIPVPASVKEMIGLRLARLRPETVRVVQAGAALGNPFSVEALQASFAFDRQLLAHALEEATSHGLLREMEPDSYQFSHALVHDAVYSSLSAPLRGQLHAQLGIGLEAFYETAVLGHAAEIARHFLLGSQRKDLSKAMGHALQAAERATAQLAFEDALRHYQMALDAHERSQRHDEGLRCELLLAVAAATFRVGDWDRCDELNLEAAEVAKSSGLPQLLSRACLATAASSPRSNPGVIPYLEDALAMLPPGDSAQRSGVLSLLACQRSMAGFWSEQAAMRNESIAMARRCGDPQALAFALRNAYIEWDPDRLEERREAVGEVVELAREMGDRELEVTSECDRLTTSLLLGDRAEVEQGIAVHIRLGDELKQRMQMAHGLMLRGMWTLLTGPLPAAERASDEMHSFTRRHRVPWAAAGLSLHTVILRWEQGRLGEIEGRYLRLLENEPSLVVRACVAFILSELGNASAAETVLEDIDPMELAALPQHAGRTFALALLAQSCSNVGAGSPAGLIYDFLLPGARHAVSINGSSTCLGSASRYLGLLAMTRRNFDDAERHFDDADSMNIRLGARPLLAHTKVDRARMHVSRDARGDLDRGRRLLIEAAQSFDELRIPFHAEQARSLLQRFPSRASLRPVYPDGLTEREVEVLRLVALGRSSREIGLELVLSVRTVERHIGNIYLKTGTHGRVEAASYALTHDLTSPTP